MRIIVNIAFFLGCILAVSLPLTVHAATNIDMFVGEARVFGTVSVNRIAVGNGKVIRGAELYRENQL